MKELHNHIFSNTTCISKETMLKYINKQLSKNELHDVEKHMLDCEFCTDAFEGMKLAQNSSILFTIDNKIDKRVGAKGNYKMRNWMVAASIIMIAFVTYITFNNSLNDSVELAVQKDLGQKEVSSFSEDRDNNSLVDQENLEPEKENEQISVVKETEEEKIIAQNNERLESKFDLKNEPSKIIIVHDDEMMEADMEIEEIKEEEIERDNVGDAPVSFSQADEINTSKPSINKKMKKAPSKPKNRFNTYDIYEYKVYDYAEEYQNEYEFKKSAQTNAVSPDFANENDKIIANKELEKETVEITYKKTLELGMKYLKNNNYPMALNQFKIILKTHPEDVNALFYSGFSYYNLTQFQEALINIDLVLTNKNTVFNQEAKWYKALILIALNEKKRAIKLLNQIIDGNEFYKEQALEKLNEL